MKRNASADRCRYAFATSMGGFIGWLQFLMSTLLIQGSGGFAPTTTRTTATLPNALPTAGMVAANNIHHSKGGRRRSIGLSAKKAAAADASASKTPAAKKKKTVAKKKKAAPKAKKKAPKAKKTTDDSSMGGMGPIVIAIPEPPKPILAEDDDDEEEIIMLPKKKRKKRKTKKDTGPSHWRNESDPVRVIPHPPVVVVDDDDDQPTTMQDDKNNNSGGGGGGQLTLTIRGNPLPLRRHRTARGFVYNPSLKYQITFAQVFRDIVQLDNPITTGDDNLELQQQQQQALLPPPFFPADQPLAASLVFALRRPNTHFTANRRGPGRLKTSAPRACSATIRQDVDNLAKFVLDSLNTYAYADDKQIVSLHIVKCLDNDDENMCEGYTKIKLWAVGNDDDNSIGGIGM